MSIVMSSRLWITGVSVVENLQKIKKTYVFSTAVLENVASASLIPHSEQISVLLSSRDNAG